MDGKVVTGAEHALDAALDGRMMRLALRAARRGRPSPNPHVGAVVARGREVVAVAHHERVGHAHAEVAALGRAGGRARGATLYVTLEPCNHHGRTGPCTEAIMRAQVARVVIGCRDPAPHVPGAIARLRAAGIQVTVPVHEVAAIGLVEDFAKHITTGFPFVIVLGAAAEIAPGSRDPSASRAGAARMRIRRLRAASDALLIGVDDLSAQDGELLHCTARRGPLLAVLDPFLSIAPRSGPARRAAHHTTLVFHGPGAARARARELAACGVELVEVPLLRDTLDLRAVLLELGKRDVVRVLAEGAAELAVALLECGHVDRMVFASTPPPCSHDHPRTQRPRGHAR